MLPPIRNLWSFTLWSFSLGLTAGLVGTQPLALADVEATVAATFSDQDLEFFEKKVRPILAARCNECHGAEAEEPGGGLVFASRLAILTGGDSGAAIVPGKPDESLLIEAINYQGLYEMPPKSKLPPQEIAILEKWVTLGAPWPTTDDENWQRPDAFDLEGRKAEHWSWQPLKQAEPPQVGNAAWPIVDADRFILRELESHNLSPNPPADKATLLRRLHYDLTGLPPTVQQVEQFQADASPQAWEKVVDQLLESPRFGEHWGRHWLDLVRYGESRGHEFDYDIPNAYQYRDYVIRAFNQDVPYDQLVIEHLAGDLLTEPRRNADDGFNESILGTGFWFLGEWVHSPVDIRKDETDRLDNMVDVMSKTFLGLTVSCARCHDHKFDAISQADYYAQFGFLKSSTYRQVRFETDAHNREIATQLSDLEKTTRTSIDAALASKSDATRADLVRTLEAIAEISTGDEADIQQVAQRHERDPQQLTAWYQHLSEARGQADHPLHLPALLLLPSSKDDPAEDLAARANHVLTTILDQSPNLQVAATADSTHRTIIDFANLASQDWRSNGPTFGTGPQQRGDWLLAADENSLVAGIRTHTAAVRDARFNGLALAAQTADESAKLGGWQAAGRTLRTPNFQLQDGRVHYLVKGAARVFAVVDSHRMVNGPLHGRVLTQFDFSPEEPPRWFTHDLRDYQGHTLHIEFVPLEDKPLEILQVVEGLSPPGLTPSTVSQRIVEHRFAGDRPNIQSPDDVFALVASVMTDSLADSKQRQNVPELAAWLWEHPPLLSTDVRPELETIAKTFRQQLQALIEKIQTHSRTAPAMWDGSATNENLLIRGNTRGVGPEVPRGMLTALKPADDTYPDTGSGRLEFARRMVSRENPYASRVMVNRIWHHLLGQGIVPSVDNFGVLGQEPSHPELLDHLAVQFMDEGWSIKRMIREIARSQTYRQSSTPSAAASEGDPNNRLLARANIRRLSGEQIRDSLLQISGRLDPTMYGPGIPTHLTPFMQGRGRPGVSGPIDGAGRRSIYLTIRRNFLSPMMLAYDMPQPFSTVGKRNQSNVPAQSLILMNDPFVLEQCDLWASQLVGQGGTSSEERIETMYLTLFARPPSGEESTMAKSFLESHAKVLNIPTDRIPTEAILWRELAHVLLNTKEFVFIR
ncbi:MAG: PSD1 and planctomycete cytochrome C domain-containing protein [Pirellulaceae bacterium]